jgi:uncharacterized protein YbgA (DUF1722 family)/uncharacterized protein YbbK (DUF523 family)
MEGEMEGKIRLGVSSCLLGNRVRYDGSHQYDSFLIDTLGQFVEYVPVCPEVECGLPTPRESLRLVGDPTDPRLVTFRSGRDYTDQMKNWAAGRLRELAKAELDGFIFKRMSPSSGMARVKVYSEAGMPSNKGIGVFARCFIKQFPFLPVEEDGRLHDPVLRENFIQRIFVHKRWRDLAATAKKRGGLVDFHTTHKLLLLSHSEKDYREMGRLVARAKDLPLNELFSRYEEFLTNALKKKSTVKKHSNVLSHIFGYFKNDLTVFEKEEVLEILDQYRQGMIPLIVPLTLMKFFAKKLKQEYLANQHYLDPHPLQLKLLNHA